ncbi:MAG: lysophospholipid acyltransferase family protein [Bacteroidales bacterium]|nr:lysophospholipid acyltransferase family protein [Bacteroidales bacterium]
MKKVSAALAYYIAAPFMYFFSVLPWAVLFIFSDIFFLLVYYVLGYRRKIVRMNLANSFPEKSHQELSRIEFRFYRYFTDMVFEMLKLLTMSPKQKLARCSMDAESQLLFKDLYSKGRSGIVIFGHYGNWEYCPSGLPLQTDFQAYLVYHPLTNPYFDRMMSSLRTGIGCKLYTMAGTLKGMIANRNELNMTAFLSDQAPRRKGAYWYEFLNQETAVHSGSEKIAQKLQLAVVYGSLERVKRGRYIFHAQMICEDASKTQAGEITENHLQLLEKDIRNAPEYWLWTHRRWKLKKLNEI